MASDEQVAEAMGCQLGDLKLAHPLVLGAGAAKHIDTEEGLEGFCKNTEASLLIGGTITYYPRMGNPGTVFYHEPHDCSKVVNWMGMPNQGIVEILDNLLEVAEKAHCRDQLIGVSVAGTAEADAKLSIEEQFVELVGAAFAHGADMVELNFGCPNTEKQPLSFSPKSIVDILSGLAFHAHRNICVKVSPYTDPALLAEVAGIFNYCTAVKGIATMNTIPNQQWLLPDGKPTIDQNNGYGGLSGECIFETALEQVKTWRRFLSPTKYIIGGGGVTNAERVLQMRQAGADAVFMVSAPLVLGHHTFGKILNDLLEYYSQ